MFGRLARFVERRAAVIVVVWLVAAAALALTAPSLQKVGTQDQTSFLPGSSPSQRTDRLLRRLFPDDPSLDASILVFARAEPLTPADHTYVGGVVEWLKHGAVGADVKTVQSVATDPTLASVLRSPDDSAELVIVGFRTAPFTTQINDVVKQIRSHLDRTAPKGLQHHLTGTGGLAADQASGLVRSFERTAIITVFLVLAILVLVYRSFLAPLIPLVTIGVAFLVARGLIAIFAEHGFKVASLAETFMVVMIFGAGTDYCLFIVSRYREDLTRGEPVPATLRRSMTVVGAVIAASAFTVIVGFLSQVTARFGIFKTMGPAMGVAIFVTLLAGLTLTPALLRLAGRHAFWPSALIDNRAGRASGRWERIAVAVAERPAEMLLAGVIALLLPAAGLGWFHESFDLVRELPTSSDARRGFDVLSRHYPSGTLAPVYIVIDADGPITEDTRLAAVDHLTDILKQQPGIGEVRSVTQPAGMPLTPATIERFGGQGSFAGAELNPDKVDVGPLFAAMSAPGGLRFTGPILAQYPQLRDGPLRFFLGNNATSTRIMVSLAGNPYDRRALPIVRDLDRTVNAAVAGTALSGAHLAVGGPASFFVDIQDIGNSDFRVMIAVLIAGIFVVLALLLRSLVAPFYLIASVVLSYAATMGLCALVFIKLLGEPGIAFFLPPFLFVILVALGADYNIFIMSRVREEAENGADIHEAVTRGLVATGRVITSAGVILAGTFAVLILAPLPQLHQIGFGVTVGVLIDTFIVRSLIVPAATMLLGPWALWPSTPHQTTDRAIRPRHVGVVGAGVVTLGTGLAVLAISSGTRSPITRIGTQGANLASADATADLAAVALSSTTSSSQASEPAGESALPSSAARRPAVGSSTTGATAVRASAPSATTTSAAQRSTSTASPGPARIATPASGSWRYHLEGTRKIGAAGTAQPYSEDATTSVSRVGGDDQSPEVRLQTQSSNGTQDDRRRYQPDAVLLLTTQTSSSGMSFGGALQPPQALARWPFRTGEQWSSTWTTGSVNGNSTTKVLGPRRLTAAGQALECWDVQTDTTFTGSAQGQQHQTACWAPTLGLSVDDHVSYQGTYNGISFDITTHLTMTATP